MTQPESRTPDAPGGPDPHRDPLAMDLAQVRLGQARLLRQRTATSCLIVEGVILYLTALILLTGEYGFALVWLGLTSAMVAAVYGFARFIAPTEVTQQNYRRYLTGHAVISAATGLVWAGLAITFLDPSSLLHLFISINIVFSITVGGMMPSAEYRPTFVALATGALLPFSTYWLVSVDGPLRLIGLGLLIYYGFGLLVSARAEVQTLESLAAERNRALTRRLQDQNRLIEKASAEKSRFLAATSHDMSQPLQAQGFFIGAMRRTLNQPEQVELLDKIESCWRGQQQLLQALVETARLDSGAIIAKSRLFDFSSVLAGLRAEFSDMAASKSITFDIADNTGPIESDPLLVTRILRNLLSNALKFTPIGGRVSLTVSETASALRVEISDTGPGIPDDQIDRIFEEYVQLDHAGSGPQRGLGLGLPIVRQLAGKLGLELEFSSTPGEGTRAAITLPRGQGQPVSGGPAGRFQSVTGAPLVVLVEDEPAVREGLAILLTDWGCRVISAASGPEATDLLSWADAEPAMLIVDKRLSDSENGIDVISGLRAEVMAEIPAILLTGDIFEFGKATELGAITVMPKPADPEHLHAALLDALSGPPAT